MCIRDRPYLLLGSAGGTTPGFPVDGVVLPLAVFDTYFGFTLGSPNTPPLAGSFGTLDPTGQAAASLSLPPGQSPGLAGLVLHHAYLSLALAPALGVDFASNAVAVELVP